MVDLNIGGIKIGTNGVSIDPNKAIDAATKMATGRLDIRLGVESDDAAKFKAALAKAGFTGFDASAPANKFTQKEKDKLLEFIKAHPEYPELDKEIGIRNLDMTVGKKAMEALEKIAQQSQAQGQAPAQAQTASPLVVRPGEKSELAGSVEKFMQDAKLPVKPNGALSAAEANAFKEHIAKLEKTTPALKGQITFDAEGNITFTQKALNLLDIEAPKGAAAAPAVQAPAAPTTAQAPAAETPASAASSPEWERAEKLAKDVKDGNLWKQGKAHVELGIMCSNEKNPAFSSPTCQDVRAKKDGQGR